MSIHDPLRVPGQGRGVDVSAVRARGRRGRRGRRSAAEASAGVPREEHRVELRNAGEAEGPDPAGGLGNNMHNT